MVKKKISFDEIVRVTHWGAGETSSAEEVRSSWDPRVKWMGDFLSVAWSRETLKVLCLPGNLEPTDPYPESGQGRARV